MEPVLVRDGMQVERSDWISWWKKGGFPCLHMARDIFPGFLPIFFQFFSSFQHSVLMVIHSLTNGNEEISLRAQGREL